jgi:2-polyprenyl-6-methoxyphenol hydroxylase-like FAD-dependent oxidoreductase
MELELTTDTPVLIVGGGPVGLAVAGELGFQGVACMLVEQGDGEVRTPKLTEVNIRTMELCRRWGIAERVHACPFPGDYPLDVAFLRDLAGDEIVRIERPARDLAPPQAHSPMAFQACSQMWFDPILREFARTHAGTALRYGMRLESFREQGDRVLATMRNLVSGEIEQIACRYLVACDGASSAVRKQLGIRLSGGVLGHTVHMHFKAPGLLESFGRAPATFFHFIDAEGLWATMRVIDPRDAMWRIMVLHLDDIEQAQAVNRDAVLRRVLGREVPVQWIDSYVWTRRSMVAETYGGGRIFLAGDSAHQFSPTGALGMNTGIADAVDLGWKLAATLQGWGGPRLLSSYGAERRPVAVRNAKATAEFYGEYTKFGGDWSHVEASSGPERVARLERLADKLVGTVGRNFRTLGLQLGHCYAQSPICAHEGPAQAGVPQAFDPHIYVASTHPGARAPHRWLPDGRSTLDLFSRGYTLLSRGADISSEQALHAAARCRGVPLTSHAIDDATASTAYGTAWTLVRPDGHVAWRGDSMPRAPDDLMDVVTGAAIGP